MNTHPPKKATEVKDVFSEESVSDVIVEYVPMPSKRHKEHDEPKQEIKEEDHHKIPSVEPETPENVDEFSAVLDDLVKSEEKHDAQVAQEHRPTPPLYTQPLSKELQKKKSGSKGFLFLLILILLIGVLVFGFYTLFSRAKDAENQMKTTPTPAPAFIQPTTEEVATPIPEQVQEATSSATQEQTEEITKKDIKIRVENGTTVAGEAARWKTFLEKAGYTVVSVGNAATQTATETTIQVNEKASSFVTQLIKDLEEKATAVESETKLSDTQKYDVLITIGK